MGRIFGTDGVRGVANSQLTPELAYQLARGGAYVLAKHKQGLGRSKVLLAQDTRISGTMLAGAMIAGFCSVGADVLWADVLPTPAVAYLTRRLEADAGVMISASHNPIEDNGIKFFSQDGFKLPDKTEKEIEELICQLEKEDSLPRPQGAGVGQVKPVGEAQALYLEFLKKTVDEDLRGLKVIVDAGHGAAWQIAPRLWQELGAQVKALNVSPTGTNINVDCGSTHPQQLQEAVRRYGADLGIAHDGDADRLIATDEKGQLLNGDYIMAICGLDLLRSGLLPQKSIVATPYSNLGLTQAFQKEGGDVVMAPNGDRYVLEVMQKRGLLLGGEQSGHIIFLNYNTTGDGLLSSLQLARVMRRTGRSLSELRGQLVEFPQCLLNVRVQKKEGWEENQAIAKAVAQVREELKDQGRIFVRPSGTEPLFRILVEGPEKNQVENLARNVGRVIAEELS
jgi:phosphoglucosamine mutase